MAFERKTFVILVTIASAVIFLHLPAVYRWHESVTQAFKTKLFDNDLLCSSADTPLPPDIETGRARAYVQYATNINYFCNAVSVTDAISGPCTHADFAPSLSTLTVSPILALKILALSMTWYCWIRRTG